jgi:hypothetical protein
MGYNRSGTRRTARLRRRKKLENRLAAKMVQGAVEKVGDARHAAVEKVKDVVK